MSIESEFYDYSMYCGQRDRMIMAIEQSQYATRRFAKMLFNVNDVNNVVWIDEVAIGTGIDASHLRAVFFSGAPLTLQDYIILADYTGIDPLFEPNANKTI